MEPDKFRSMHESIKRDSSARIYVNEEWIKIEKAMKVFIAREPDATSQLSKFLVGKSLVLQEPRVLGQLSHPRTTLIEAESVTCWDRPFLVYRKIGMKEWNFSEYTNIKRAVLLTRDQMWEREQGNNPSIITNQVNIILKFWDMASCVQLRDAIESLSTTTANNLHRTISTIQFLQIGKYIKEESDERFWFVMGRKEADFHEYFQIRSTFMRPKSVGEFRDAIRWGNSIRHTLAGFRLAMKYDSSEFARLHGDELKYLCDFNRSILPVHST